MSRPLVQSPNKNKQYLKYYVLPRYWRQRNHTTFNHDDCDVRTCHDDLRCIEIIGRKYYDSSSSRNKIERDTVEYTQSGTYLDRNDVERQFIFTVLPSGNKKTIILENGIVTLVGIVSPSNLAYVADSMFVTMRSTEVNEDEVVAYYSNKEIIDYKAVHENFFDHKVPEEGSLIEIYNQLHPDNPIEVPKTEQPAETPKE
ncbi:hypothetical protein MGH68_12975 [Erysipelothrix sp. D19-032]